jgi:predicted RNA-binding protein with PIN domain
MPFLIDGYNLLHAIGRLTPRAGKHALEGARRDLLILLAGGHGTQAGDVTVVFDAQAAPPGVPRAADHGGVRVLFSTGQTADDLIEELLRAEHQPRRLTVVSDDNRIREAARRRGCVVLGCLDYVESLRAPRRPPSPAPAAAPAKPEQSSAEEKEHWLEAFKDADGQGPPY